MTPSKNPTRSFLLAQPRPVRVRLKLVDGEVRMIETGASPQWKRLAETIDALAPTTIEALDASGNLLRARNPELAAERDELDPGVLEEEDPTTPLQGDGEFETVARLLADAHRSSGERAFQFVETAFAKMVEIVNAQTRRMDAMERVVDGMHRVWRRSFEQQLAEVEEETPSQASTLQQMLATFMASQAQATVAKATSGNPTTNGVHTPRPGGT